MRTLMVHTGAIGDFILSCPALTVLGQAGPVTLLGNPERLKLAEAAGLAEEALALDAVDFHTVYTTPSERLATFLGGFHRVVLWWADEDGRLAEAIRACGPTQVQCFPGLPPKDWRRHASHYYAACLGISPETLPETPPLQALALQDVPGATLPPKSLVLHPGSGGMHKCWPLEHFQTLSARLSDAGYRLYWCRGPAEEAMDFPSHVERLEHIPLTTLASVLAQAKLFIGNDSGIAHLAAATGCPTVALFGPTNPAVWAPRGAWVTVLRSGSGWPAVETVWQALQALGIE